MNWNILSAKTHDIELASKMITYSIQTDIIVNHNSGHSDGQQNAVNDGNN